MKLIKSLFTLLAIISAILYFSYSIDRIKMPKDMHISQEEMGIWRLLNTKWIVLKKEE